MPLLKIVSPKGDTEQHMTRCMLPFFSWKLITKYSLTLFSALIKFTSCESWVLMLVPHLGSELKNKQCLASLCLCSTHEQYMLSQRLQPHSEYTLK